MLFAALHTKVLLNSITNEVAYDIVEVFVFK